MIIDGPLGVVLAKLMFCGDVALVVLLVLFWLAFPVVFRALLMQMGYSWLFLYPSCCKHVFPIHILGTVPLNP